MVAGDQVPVIPLVEVPGKAGAVLFWQRGPICAKAGVTCGSMVISLVTLIAHWPGLFGVKEYGGVPARGRVLVSGDQVSLNTLVEGPGKAGAVLFWQRRPHWAKAGGSRGAMV